MTDSLCECIPARDLRAGDDLFGFGVIETVIVLREPFESIVVGRGDAQADLNGDEEVTVRRG